MLVGGRYSCNDRHASFLPWAHVFGQSVELHGAVAMGAALGCVASPLALLQDLPLIRPTVLVGVPQVPSPLPPRPTPSPGHPQPHLHSYPGSPHAPMPLGHPILTSGLLSHPRRYSCPGSQAV